MTEENTTTETVAKTADARYDPSVLRKLNTIRGMVLTMDWVPDKVMKIGQDRSKWYNYLSIDKIKANLGPIFAKAGVEIIPRYEDIQFRGAIGNMSQHITLTMVVDAVDIETGAYVTYRTPGEAADSGDKALSKAQTYALKSWLSTIFLLAEGFDPDMTDGEAADGLKAFTRPSATEAVEMKSKVLDAGVKPAKPAVKPAEPAKPAVKPAEPVTKPAEPAKPAGAVKKPTAIQEKAMDKAVENWSQAVRDGKADASKFAEVSEARAAVTSQSEAVDFLSEFGMVN